MKTGTILRMKSLIFSAVSTFSPNVSKPTSYLPSFSLSSVFNYCNFAPARNPKFVHVKPTKLMSSLKSIPNTAPSLHTDAPQLSFGEIHVIVGPMFAGKTTTLLRRVRSESLNGRSVAIIKSNKDTRYGLGSIVTHDGEKFPCWPLADLSSFKQTIGPDAYEKLEVIGIDEAQFFGDLYDFCSEVADYDGKTVIVAGLDGDYLRRSFGKVLDIIPIADSVTKLSARCEVCGKRAFFTLRKIDETKTELIGGADVYMPVCRRHHVSGQVFKEATRTVLDSQKVQCSSLL